MKTGKPQHGSGKTRGNRIKRPGQSWLDAIGKGYSKPQPPAEPVEEVIVEVVELQKVIELPKQEGT